jgi:hypothetical protein
MKEIVYMRRKSSPTSTLYYGLQLDVIYKCVRVRGNGYKNPDSKRSAYWVLEGFEQVSNVEVLTQIFTGKVIPVELPE